MSYDYDVVVAGGGIAGSLAAASASKHGAKTILLDRNDTDEIGKKTNWGWVCGEAVAKGHIDFIQKELGVKLSYPDIDTNVDGIYVLSPDLKNKFLFEGEGYVLNRPKIAKTLVKYAVDNGAEYRPRYEVEGPIVENGELAGVFGKDDKTQRFDIRARIVIDCLGMASTLRRRLPQNEFIEKDIRIEDIESTGRYIAKFEPASDDTNYYDPKNAIIHLNQLIAPGGYGWVFPKSNGRVNIGIGVEKKSLDKRNEKLGKKDTLHSLIDEYVGWNKVVKNIEMDDTDKNGKGYWSVSVRRQFDSLVYKNYLGAGDSVAMPNPISAGGIGPAMIAGVLAGQVASEAIAANDTSMNFLWKYNVMFNNAYGNKTAALEAFRVYLQSLNNDLINYGMSHFLTKEEATVLTYGKIPEISIASTFQKIISGIANINAFKNLLFTVSKMKKLLELYKNYPKDLSSFKQWKQSLESEMQEVKNRFPVNPV
ncbi:MAG: NAD(P)/FAD-dependent oxidoreductase [Candidatus Micrarchaeales archaeon]